MVQNVRRLGKSMVVFHLFEKTKIFKGKIEALPRIEVLRRGK